MRLKKGGFPKGSSPFILCAKYIFLFIPYTKIHYFNVTLRAV